MRESQGSQAPPGRGLAGRRGRHGLAARHTSPPGVREERPGVTGRGGRDPPLPARSCFSERRARAGTAAAVRRGRDREEPLPGHWPTAAAHEGLRSPAEQNQMRTGQCPVRRVGRGSGLHGRHCHRQREGQGVVLGKVAGTVRSLLGGPRGGTTTEALELQRRRTSGRGTRPQAGEGAALSPASLGLGTPTPLPRSGPGT